MKNKNTTLPEQFKKLIKKKRRKDTFLLLIVLPQTFGVRQFVGKG
jgi:hypothetical protein